MIGDLVLSGIAGGEEGARGFVDAYRAATGKRVWRFWTIPARGEKGAETWIGNALEHGCGATWVTGSYDATLGLTYWTVGNPCPDFNGDERKGDNLYTSSVVALDAKTGTLKWHFQFTPHDTHDWDSTAPLILIDEPWEGRPRKLLAHADPNGFFFVLDRTDGKLLLASPLGPQNWTTGYGKDGRPVLTEHFESTLEGTVTCHAGATKWASASFDPVSKLFVAGYRRVAPRFGRIRPPRNGPAILWRQRIRGRRRRATELYPCRGPPDRRKGWDYPLLERRRVGHARDSGRIGVLRRVGWHIHGA